MSGNKLCKVLKISISCTKHNVQKTTIFVAGRVNVYKKGYLKHAAICSKKMKTVGNFKRDARRTIWIFCHTSQATFIVVFVIGSNVFNTGQALPCNMILNMATGLESMNCRRIGVAC